MKKGKWTELEVGVFDQKAPNPALVYGYPTFPDESLTSILSVGIGHTGSSIAMTSPSGLHDVTRVSSKFGPRHRGNRVFGTE